LSEKLANSSPPLTEALLKMAGDDDFRVRLQLAYSYGELNEPAKTAALKRLAKVLGNDADLRTAFLTSVATNADHLTLALLDDGEFAGQPHAAVLISSLAQVVGSKQATPEVVALLIKAAALKNALALQRAIVRSLGEGLSRSGSSLARLLAGGDVEPANRDLARALFREAAEVAGRETASAADRQAAVELLSFADFDTAAGPLENLLTPQTPQTLQRAAVRALSEHDSPKVADLLLESWRSYSPEVRRETIDGLLRRADRIQTLLTAVESQIVQRGEIERDKKQLLMNHPNEAVRNRSRKLFGGEVSSNRAKIVADYQQTLELSGDAERGRQLFTQKCAVCHKVGDAGHQVGPDLASTRNKSAGDLLISILDPNREAQPNFNTYTVVTQEGKILNGIITADTATSLTLKRAEGKEDTVLRSTIETLVSNGVSLMPEGMEKEFNPQQMADVIEFVRTIPPAKSE
jgi:putative heme-binding domain-containing protein